MGGNSWLLLLMWLQSWRRLISNLKFEKDIWVLVHKTFINSPKFKWNLTCPEVRNHLRILAGLWSESSLEVGPNGKIRGVFSLNHLLDFDRNILCDHSPIEYDFVSVDYFVFVFIYNRTESDRIRIIASCQKCRLIFETISYWSLWSAVGFNPSLTGSTPRLRFFSASVYFLLPYPYEIFFSFPIFFSP